MYRNYHFLFFLKLCFILGEIWVIFVYIALTDVERNFILFHLFQLAGILLQCSFIMQVANSVSVLHLFFYVVTPFCELQCSFANYMSYNFQLIISLWMFTSFSGLIAWMNFYLRVTSVFLCDWAGVLWTYSS